MRLLRNGSSASAGWLCQKTGSRWLVAGLVALAVALYGKDITDSRGASGDSYHHLINGIFLYDALREPARSVAHPWQYGHRYYLHYPAVNLGYYMPVFPMLEALLMAVFGVSPVTGQAAVLLMAVLMTLFAFAWFRLRFGPGWAAGGTVALITTPILVFWGRDIMLEIPALALVIGSVWLFERLLRSDRPDWITAWAWALTTSLAFWTKQPAIMLLGVFAVSTLAARRWTHLRFPSITVPTLFIIIAAGALIGVTLSFGGAPVAHTVGFTPQDVVDRFNVWQWTYYLARLPEILGWPTLVLGSVGLLAALNGKQRWLSPILAWILCFYLMHSFFPAQEARYGCMWVPPFCMLALIGVRSIGRTVALWWRPLGLQRAGSVSALLLVLYSGAGLVQSTRVREWRVSPVFQRAADDLCDRLAPYTCMTFLRPPGRVAVCFRLAVEQRRSYDREIHSFGRILRSDQVLRNWQERWPDVQSVAAALADWNVKYIIAASPRRSGPLGRDAEESDLAERLLGLGQFRAVRSYPLTASPPHSLFVRRHLPERILTLYERIEPIPFRPEARPPIRTLRIPIDVGIELTTEKG